MQAKKHTDKQGVICGKLHPRAFDAAREMPGRRKWKDRNLYFELSSANLEFLSEFFGDLLEWDDSLKKELTKIEENRRLEEETRARKGEEVIPVENFPFKTKPMDHQLRAFSLARGRKAFGYLMEQGTGKTKIAIDDAAHLYMEGSMDLLLITAPNGVHIQWVREQIPEHMPECVPYKTFTHLGDWGKKKQEELYETLSYKDGLRIVAVNIEALSHKSGIDLIKKILSSSSNSMWIQDESSRIKNYGSKRTKNCLKLSKEAKYRRILSGTPITRGLEDLYSQLGFLDEDILGHRSFYTFRNEYCVMGGFEGRQIVSYQNVEKLSNRLEGHTFRITKDECLDLPPVTFTKREVSLTPEQRKLYNSLKEDFIIALDSGEFQEVPLAITRLIRFQQILCGHIPNFDLSQESDSINEEFERIKTNRPQSVVEFLGESQGKTIIWTKFRMDDKILQETFKKNGIKYVRYQSDMTKDQQWESKQQFQDDEDIQVLLTHPGVAGIGLNLTAARNCLWYGLPTNLEEYLQANDRIARHGQEHPMTNVHLSTTGTVDEKLFKLLEHKRFLADTTLDHDKFQRFGGKLFESMQELREAV